MTHDNNDLDNVPHSPLDQDQRSAKNAPKPSLSLKPKPRNIVREVLDEWRQERQAAYARLLETDNA